MVRAPVGHLAAGIIPKETKEVMDALFVVGPVGSGTEPHLVIQFRRRGAVLSERILRPIHPYQSDEHALDFADTSIAHVFRGLKKLRFGALLAAALHDAFGLARRLHE